MVLAVSGLKFGDIVRKQEWLQSGREVTDSTDGSLYVEVLSLREVEALKLGA